MRLEDVIADELGYAKEDDDGHRIPTPQVAYNLAAAVRAWVLDDAQVERARDAVFVASCSDVDIPVAVLRALFGEEEG